MLLQDNRNKNIFDNSTVTLTTGIQHSISHQLRQRNQPSSSDENFFEAPCGWYLNWTLRLMPEKCPYLVWQSFRHCHCFCKFVPTDLTLITVMIMCTFLSHHKLLTSEAVVVHMKSWKVISKRFIKTRVPDNQRFQATIKCQYKYNYWVNRLCPTWHKICSLKDK